MNIFNEYGFEIMIGLSILSIIIIGILMTYYMYRNNIKTVDLVQKVQQKILKS
jgi:hypothetical protein